jgi:predicted small secreted protein
MMRKFLPALAAVFVLSGLTACNTMRGVGEDISAFGRYLSSSSGTSSPHTAPPPPSSF